jgi:murein DD-endopeptidase MepM/ murein hydrolase activator NlpD
MSSSIKTALWGFVVASVVVQTFVWLATSTTQGSAYEGSEVTESDSELGVAHPSSADKPTLLASSALAETGLPVAPAITMSLYTVKAGDTLSTIWQKIGGQKGGLESLIKALNGVGITAKSLRVGETLKYTKSDSGDIAEIHKPLSAPDSVIVKKDPELGYSALINQPKVILKERPVVGKIERSLSEAALALDVPYEVIDAYVDLFSGRVEFRRDLQPGDEFTIIYNEKRLESGELIGPGDIQAASLMINGEMMAAVRHQGSDGTWRYFDELGESLAKTFLRYPVSFSRISSVFSSSRFHPVLKKRRAHNGVDFAAPTGTPVRAVADGVVTLAGWAGGGGRTIKLTHGSRYATAYLHLSQINPKVKKGVRVKRGEIIGKVGASGLATGPHLHFSFYDRGIYVDPLSTKLPRMDEGPGAKISKENLAAALLKLKQFHFEEPPALSAQIDITTSQS